RANDAQYADDAAGAVAIGRNDGRGARKREELILRADEDTGALGALRLAEEIDHATLRFEIIEQKAHPLEVLNCFEIVEPVSRTPASRVRSDSIPDASLSTASMDLPTAATLASISRRSDSARSPISISASTKKRKPSSGGNRPADVCGA